MFQTRFAPPSISHRLDMLLIENVFLILILKSGAIIIEATMLLLLQTRCKHCIVIIEKRGICINISSTLEVLMRIESVIYFKRHIVHCYIKNAVIKYAVLKVVLIIKKILGVLSMIKNTVVILNHSAKIKC